MIADRNQSHVVLLLIPISCLQPIMCVQVLLVSDLFVANFFSSPIFSLPIYRCLLHDLVLAFNKLFLQVTAAGPNFVVNFLNFCSEIFVIYFLLVHHALLESLCEVVTKPLVQSQEGRSCASCSQKTVLKLEARIFLGCK